MASCAILGSLPDEDLVSLCRQGEDDAFSLLYNRYKGRVLLTTNRIIRDPEGARDAAQEIFLKVYLSLRQWDAGKSRLSTWLYRLASNYSIDCWRARQRRLRVEDCSSEATESEGVCDSKLTPEGELVRREQADELRRSVDRLPTLQRRFFILRHYHGLTLEEIAQHEGRSLGTVKGSLFRATRAIGRRLSRTTFRADQPAA